MGKYKGTEARYNVLSVRLDDDLAESIRSLVPAGVTLSDYLRDLLRRECGVYQNMEGIHELG